MRWWFCAELLHKTGDMRAFPFSGQTCPRELRDGCAKGGEPGKDRDTDLELCNPTVEFPRGEAQPEKLDAVQPGFCAASAMVTPPKTRADQAGVARGNGPASMDARMQEFRPVVPQAHDALGDTEPAARKFCDRLTARSGSLARTKAVLGDVPAIRQAFMDVQCDLSRHWGPDVLVALWVT
jgi:hypothetical protein